MFAAVASVVVCTFLAGGGKKEYDGGVLCQPAYVMDDALRGPCKRYAPQPGDIFLSTDRSWIINAGHRLAWSGQPNHSGIVVLRRDGTPALLEGGPFNGIKIEIVDIKSSFDKHDERTEKVWIRARKVPLTKLQSEQLTEWAERQDGKAFAVRRMLRQMTPFRTRGPLRTFVMGTPNGERDRYFCAELVMETCVHIGLLSAETTRPSATYPEDIFYDKSKNRYLNENFTLAGGWEPPARWLPAAPVPAGK
ncbi:MAG: hypothetical protein FJ303_16770 [Planctomycetes bacterium]|nr:hypothetical protein [Planctomycetota bacterium]